MSTTTVKPDHADWITPSLTVSDIESSLKFYQKAFGFEPAMVMRDDNGKATYADMNYKGKTVAMLLAEGCWDRTAQAPSTSKTAPAVSLYVYCDDVNALHQQAVESGAQVLCEPEDMFWGDRTTNLQDPQGYVWMFATKVFDYQPATA